MLKGKKNGAKKSIERQPSNEQKTANSNEVTDFSEMKVINPEM